VTTVPSSPAPAQPVPGTSQESVHARCRCRPVLLFLQKRKWVYVELTKRSDMAFLSPEAIQAAELHVCPGCGYGYRYSYGKAADAARTRDRLS
jgi:hypothetical protein